MANISRISRQIVKGLPYLKKELARDLSIRTGMVLTAPVTYYIIFSGKCNLACSFCTIYKEPDPILTEETMLRLVREAKELSGSGFNISLSGGEPTIYKPTYSSMALARELGVNFGMTTNGLALTKDNVKRILGHDPFNINISLESVDPEINEKLRPGRFSTQRTLQGIANLLEEKKRTGARVSVIVKPTITEINFHTLPDLVRHFGKEGPVQVNFQPFVGSKDDPHWVKNLSGFAGMVKELKSLRDDGYPIIGDDETLDGFVHYFENPPPEGELPHLDLNGKKRNCDIGLRSMFIYPNGDAHFCDFLKKPIGNIHQNSLREIFRGETADRQRHHMVNCSIDCQQTCKRKSSLMSKARAFLKMG